MRKITLLLTCILSIFGMARTSAATSIATVTQLTGNSITLTDGEMVAFKSAVDRGYLYQSGTTIKGEAVTTTAGYTPTVGGTDLSGVFTVKVVEGGYQLMTSTGEYIQALSASDVSVGTTPATFEISYNTSNAKGYRIMNSGYSLNCWYSPSCKGEIIGTTTGFGNYTCFLIYQVTTSTTTAFTGNISILNSADKSSVGTSTTTVNSGSAYTFLTAYTSGSDSYTIDSVTVGGKKVTDATYTPTADFAVVYYVTKNAVAAQKSIATIGDKYGNATAGTALTFTDGQLVIISGGRTDGTNVTTGKYLSYNGTAVANTTTAPVVGSTDFSCVWVVKNGTTAGTYTLSPYNDQTKYLGEGSLITGKTDNYSVIADATQDLTIGSIDATTAYIAKGTSTTLGIQITTGTPDLLWYNRGGGITGGPNFKLYISPVTISGGETPAKKDSVTLTMYGSTYQNDTFVESVGTKTIKVEKGSTYTFPATIQFGTTTYNVGTVTYAGKELGPYADAQLNNVAVGTTITLTADASYSAYLILSNTPAKKDSVTLSIDYFEYKTDKSTWVGELGTIKTKLEKGSTYVIPATISYNGKTYNLSVITTAYGTSGPIFDTGSGKTLAVGTSIVMTQDSAMYGYIVEAVDHFTGTVSYQNAADGTDLQTATTLTIKPGDTYTIPTTVTIDGKSYTIESANVDDTEATVGATITPTSDFTVLLICRAVVTDGIDAAETTKTAVYYDLQGRRIMNPTHGVFIVNGKKVVK